MRGLVGVAFAALWLAAGEAQAAKLIAVLPLDVSNTKGKLDKAGQVSLEEMLRDMATNALRPLGWTILSGENTIQVLIDNGVKPEECGNQSCHLANARELKAEAFISGSVQFVDGAFIASIRLIDTATGSLLTSERVRGKTVTALSTAFEAKAQSFFERAGLLPPGTASPRETPVAPPSVEATRPQVSRNKVTAATGTLTVIVEPKAAVRLELVDPEGKKIASGVPYENRAALPGRWTVTAKASGYEEEEQSIEVPPDEATVVKLDLKLLGGLSVLGEPKGAAVEVTGPGGFREDGGLPWTARGLKSGTYQVKVSRKGYTDANESVMVEPGRTASVKVALQKSGAGQWKTKVDPKSGLEFVSLPGGTFHSGCEPGDDDCRDTEKPGAAATVAPFWLGKTEVTVEAYAKCVSAGVCDKPGTSGACNWGVKGKEKHPINCVDWNQATRFCEWIGGRLPTGEEWEYAAKGGESRIRPWGNEEVAADRANICDARCGQAHPDWKVTNSADDGWSETAPVASYPGGASKHGLMDMIGNVYEWTQRSAGKFNRREIRGGSWMDDFPRNLRSSLPGWMDPTPGRDFLGARCAL